MNLFDFLYRGATVYVAAGQIAQKPRAMQVCLQLPQARQYMRPTRAELRRSREQCKSACDCRGATAYAGRRTELRRSREQCKSACNCLRRDSICGRAIPCGNACGRFFRYMYGARNQFSHKKAGPCKPLSLKRDNEPFLSCPNPCRPQERPRVSKPNR